MGPEAMDRVFIRDFKVNCLIGIHPHERVQPQELLLNLSLETSTLEAAETDDIGKTIDYEKLKNRIGSYITSTQFLLLEKLAQEVARLCLEEPMASGVTLRIEKVGIFPDCHSVGIEITRRKRS